MWCTVLCPRRRDRGPHSRERWTGDGPGMGCHRPRSGKRSSRVGGADVRAAQPRGEHAGIGAGTPSLELAPDEWQSVFDTNVNGVFYSCQAEARAMRLHGRGSIVNIASISATIANRDLTQAQYNSSKAAVVHLTKSLAVEWAPLGIRVNAVSPGYTLTPMNRRPEVADLIAEFADTTPLGRLAEPDEIAGPVLFLLGPAASYITGVDLLVDGGYCCW